jgi:hypothetical protein
MGQQSKCYTKRKWENRPNEHGLKDPITPPTCDLPGKHMIGVTKNDPNNQ